MKWNGIEKLKPLRLMTHKEKPSQQGNVGHPQQGRLIAPTRFNKRSSRGDIEETKQRHKYTKLDKEYEYNSSCSLQSLNLGFGCISISSFSLSVADEMILCSRSDRPHRIVYFLRTLQSEHLQFCPHLSFAAFFRFLFVSCVPLAMQQSRIKMLIKSFVVFWPLRFEKKKCQWFAGEKPH